MSREFRNKRPEAEKDAGPELIEKVVHINRCAKVVKGGRRFTFSALVVLGDGAGKIGLGYGKAKEVPDAIKKASDRARKAMKPISLKDTTIPHEVVGEYDGGIVIDLSEVEPMIALPFHPSNVFKLADVIANPYEILSEVENKGNALLGLKNGTFTLTDKIKNTTFL